MTHGDVARVLTAAAARDARTIGDADVLAWHQDIGDLNFTDALEAVSRHYRETTDRIMPAHVRRIAVQLDRDRRRALRESAEQRAIESEAAQRQHTEDRSDDVAQLIADLRKRLGDYDRNVLRRAEWVHEERIRQRAEAEPNPLYTGPPPPGGHPVPEPDAPQEP
jgi:hypothetical protein